MSEPDDLEKANFASLVAAAQAAVDRRDAEDAADRNITVDVLRAEREAASRRDETREIRESRIERLGKDARLITPADFGRVVSTEPGAMDGTKAWRLVERFARSGKCFLVMSGPRGVGKTVACCALKARLGGLIVSADEMTRAHRNEHQEALRCRSAMADVSTLIIDDLGLEGDVDAGVRAFQATINERQGPGMRTVVTTNLSKTQIVTRYDARTTERILHGGAIVELTGQSLRGVS